MKVVRAGGKSGWRKEIPCSCCGALLLVDLQDLYRKTEFVETGVIYHVAFICCACGAVNQLPDGESPLHPETLGFRGEL